MWPDMQTSVPTPSCWCNLKKALSQVLRGGFLVVDYAGVCVKINSLQPTVFELL